MRLTPPGVWPQQCDMLETSKRDEKLGVAGFGAQRSARARERKLRGFAWLHSRSRESVRSSTGRTRELRELGLDSPMWQSD